MLNHFEGQRVTHVAHWHCHIRETALIARPVCAVPPVCTLGHPVQPLRLPRRLAVCASTSPRLPVLPPLPCAVPHARLPVPPTLLTCLCFQPHPATLPPLPALRFLPPTSASACFLACLCPRVASPSVFGLPPAPVALWLAQPLLSHLVQSHTAHYYAPSDIEICTLRVPLSLPAV
ncbi:hypothetical protein BJV78DRAFT_624667 [Lactifluus subvellereus]|nr:hypothetical protein BJV78DRAFT_624667 [Lactifluus subvellereus]